MVCSGHRRERIPEIDRGLGVVGVTQHGPEDAEGGVSGCAWTAAAKNDVTGTLSEASRGTMVIGIPDLSTRSAAAASTYTFHSARCLIGSFPSTRMAPAME